MGEVYANRMIGVSENNWKAFVEQRRAAAKAEREWLKKNPTTPQQAIASSLELLNIYESLHGDPFVKDEITLREEEEARQAWKRLYERWPRGG